MIRLLDRAVIGAAGRFVDARRAVLASVLAMLPITGFSPVTAQVAEKGDWQSLFDGKTLANWQPSKFSGAGAPRVESGQIVLEAGRDLSGITWSGTELPKTNYEVALQAMRLEGSDFFAGVTFPVGDSFCSFILGGWGGQVIGLSSVDGFDASENATSQSKELESKRWYNVRIRVTPAKIQVWLDDSEIISQDIKGRRIDTRIEMDPSKPLGIATWKTNAALRDIRLRRLE